MQNKKTIAELQQLIADAKTKVLIGKEYLHYKNKKYKAVEIAITEATNEPAVVYEALYAPGVRFIRPVSDWIKIVDAQGVPTPRFRLADD